MAGAHLGRLTLLRRQPTLSTSVDRHLDGTMSLVLQPWQLLLMILAGWVSRRVHSAGCTVNPTADWMKQIGRNLTDPFDGFLLKVRYLLMDRDSKYCPEFRALLKEAGVNGVRLPPRSPNLTPHIERFMHSIKAECLERMIFFGDAQHGEAVVRVVERQPFDAARQCCGRTARHGHGGIIPGLPL